MTGLKVGVVGLGYWGPKLARCFKELGVLEAVHDLDAYRQAQFAHDNVVKGWSQYEDLLAFVDAVAIATPPETHYALAKQALKAGKHVFVEKPLATTYKEARELELLAVGMGEGIRRVGGHLALAVGHIYLHCPGLMAIPVPVGAADLYASLLNEAGPPSDSTRDLLWAGLPHAASIALHFFPEWPVRVTIIPWHTGYGAPVNRDRIQARLDYFNGSRAFLDVADYVGMKRRAVELRVGNTHFYYDGATPNEHVCATGRGVDIISQTPKNSEPLLAECEAFLKAVEQKAVDPLGAKVVALIEAIRDGEKCPHLPFR